MKTKRLISLIENIERKSNPPAGETVWYLTTGISNSDVVAAYQARGASSYANSKVNLVNAGTYDLVDTGHSPDWNGATGWSFNGTSQYFIVPTFNVSETTTFIIHLKNVSETHVQSGFSLNNQDTGKYLTIWYTFDDGEGLKYFVADFDGAGINEWQASLSTEVILAINYNGAYKDGNIWYNWARNPDSFSTNKSMGIGSVSPYSLFYEGDIISFAFYNKTLTPTQIAAITNNMNAIPARYFLTVQNSTSGQSGEI